ncbi:MAG: extracellular solute-binding protein [Streptosporangiales bacterium]|nr:extracellular solute-binding protein [Streptosporangiales bacterium]
MPYDSLTRRRLLQAFGALAAGATVAGCAGPGSSSNDKPSGIDTTGPVEGDLSFAHWRAEDKKAFADIIDAFTKANSKVSVRQDISPSYDYQSKALQQIRGGNVGDVFVAFRGAQFVDMVGAGLYADLSKQPWAENYDQELAAPGKHDGELLGFPYQYVFNMPVYNVNLLQKAGYEEPPTDWDGFLAMCRKLKAQGVTPIAWPGGEPGNAGHLLNSMVMNNAPSDDMFAKMEAGDYKATDDWYVHTLEQYAQLRPYFQKNATGTQVEPAEQMFVDEKAAMLATGSFHIIALRAVGAKFPMDCLAPITVAEKDAKYQGIHNATFILGVNTKSDNTPAAVKFLEYLSDPKVAVKYADATVQHSTIKGVEYTNKDLKALEPWLEKKTMLAPRFQFVDLDIAAAVENAAIEVVGGKDPEKAAQAAEKIADQRRK